MNRFNPLTSKLMFAVLVVLVWTALSAAAHADGQTLWAVVVTDTADPNIGTSVDIDRRNVESLLGEIAEESGLGLQIQSISGKFLSGQQLVAALNKIHPGSDDVVFFYFSGHGTRDMDSKDPWPLLAVGDDLVPFHTVLSVLDSANPRLVIALADACNRNVDDDGVGAIEVADNSADKLWSYKSLFADTKGYFVATASSPGELSTTIDERGSAFTKSFVTAMEYAMKSAGGTWNTVRDIATQPIMVMFSENRMQTPFTAMDIRGLGDPMPLYPF